MSDFDNDGFDDLVLGARRESIGAILSAGAANVLRGSAAGLTAVGNQFWHQDSTGIASTAEADDLFASALASGDFDNDGFDDLAIGVRGESVGALEIAGAVNVLGGSGAGLTDTGSQIWHQDSTGIRNSAESDDSFGSALAVGDFNNDGFDDLAVGVNGEDVGTAANAGAVNVLRGSAAGLTATGDEFFTDFASTAEASDFFGDALAVGDFNNDGFDDLAIGANREDVGAFANAGAVSVLHGSGAGLTATGGQIWHQDSTGIRNGAEKDDRFGDALAVGDFNNDGFDDLAVGVPGEDIGAFVSAGAVNVLRGSAAGLTATGDEFWNQDSPHVANTVDRGDFFGAALASADFNNDGFDDLAVGVPGEDIPGAANAGLVNVLYGSAAGLTSTGTDVWHQDIAGIGGTAEAEDKFGEFLSTGDFNNDGFADLAIGAPGEDVGSARGAGQATVLFGSAARLTAAGDQTWHQESAGILDVAETGDAFGGWLV